MKISMGTDPPPSALAVKEETYFNVFFTDIMGMQIHTLSEYAVPFCRVLDLLKLFRNELDGLTPALSTRRGLFPDAARITIEEAYRGKEV